MPYYGQTDGSDIQQGMQGNFNPYTGRLNGGNMVLEFLARMAGQKEKAKQDEWDIEDRDLNKRYKEDQISNYGETTQRNPTSIEERIALYDKDPKKYRELFPEAGQGQDQYTFPEENYPMIEKKLGLVKDSLKRGTPKFRQDAFQRFNDIANPKTNTQTGSAAWKDEATNLGKLITAKISNVDKEIERYNGYKKKADEELRKYGSMKNKLAGQKSLEAKQASDEANKSIRMLELYKRQMMAHQTNINPNNPVDETTKSAIVSDYPKTISDIIYGGQNLDLGTSGGVEIPETPGEGDGRTVRRNGVIVNQIYKNGGWVDIEGK